MIIHGVPFSVFHSSRGTSAGAKSLEVIITISAEYFGFALNFDQFTVSRSPLEPCGIHVGRSYVPAVMPSAIPTPATSEPIRMAAIVNCHAGDKLWRPMIQSSTSNSTYKRDLPAGNNLLG